MSDPSHSESLMSAKKTASTEAMLASAAKIRIFQTKEEEEAFEAKKKLFEGIASSAVKKGQDPTALQQAGVRPKFPVASPVKRPAGSLPSLSPQVSHPESARPITPPPADAAASSTAGPVAAKGARVFVWDEPDGTGITITLSPTMTFDQLLELIGKKMGIDPPKRVYYQNGAMITEVEDLREGDEVYLINLRQKSSSGSSLASPVAAALPVPTILPTIVQSPPQTPKADSAGSPSGSTSLVASPRSDSSRSPRNGAVDDAHPAAISPHGEACETALAGTITSPRSEDEGARSDASASSMPKVPHTTPEDALSPRSDLNANASLTADSSDSESTESARSKKSSSKSSMSAENTPKKERRKSRKPSKKHIEKPEKKDDKKDEKKTTKRNSSKNLKEAVVVSPVATSPAPKRPRKEFEYTPRQLQHSASLATVDRNHILAWIDGKESTRTNVYANATMKKSDRKRTYVRVDAHDDFFVSRSTKDRHKTSVGERKPIEPLEVKPKKKANRAQSMATSATKTKGIDNDKLSGSSETAEALASQSKSSPRVTVLKDKKRPKKHSGSSLPPIKEDSVALSSSPISPSTPRGGDEMTDSYKSNLSERSTSSHDTSDTEDDFDETNLLDMAKLEKQAMEFVGDSDKNFNPLALSDEEVLRRMSAEEKQDLENVEVDEETGAVKAGTLRALLRRMLSHLQDPEFVDSFLLTYDVFIDPVTLFKIIIMMFRAPLTSEEGIKPFGVVRRSSLPQIQGIIVSPAAQQAAGTPLGSSPPNSNVSPSKLPVDRRESVNSSPVERQRVVIQFRMISIIKNWITLRFDKVKKNKGWMELYAEFADWLARSANDKYRSWGQMLVKHMKDARHQRRSLKEQLERLKGPTLGGVSGRGNFDEYKSIVDIAPEEIARQLTLIEQEIFQLVSLAEYSNGNFSSKDKERKAPHLNAMINRFNRMSYWIATTIILALATDSSPKQRANIMQHMILVMEQLLKLKNFHSVMQFFSALNMSCVSRLQKAWSFVSTRHKQILDDIGKLFLGNYRGYRAELELAEPPCIPLQDIVCRDLTFIEENPNVLENGWINFEKLLLVGKSFKNIKRFQSLYYDFPVNHSIQVFLNSQIVLTENELFDQSKRVEPPEYSQSPARATRPVSNDGGSAKKPKKPKDDAKKAEKKKDEKKKPKPKLVVEYVFEKVLADLELYNQFEQYLVSIHAEEILVFYARVMREFKAIDFKAEDSKEKAKSVAQALVSTFISLSGSQAIALADGQRLAVEKVVKHGKGPITEKLFDNVIGDITFQLRGHFTSFKISIGK